MRHRADGLADWLTGCSSGEVAENSTLSLALLSPLKVIVVVVCGGCGGQTIIYLLQGAHTSDFNQAHPFFSRKLVLMSEILMNCATGA